MVGNRQSDDELDAAEPLAGDPGGDVGIVRVDMGDGGAPVVGFLPESWGRLTQEQRAALVGLQRVALERRQLRDVLDNLAIDAREAGASWNALGWCVGLSGEGARQRWKDLERPALPEWAQQEDGAGR